MKKTPFKLGNAFFALLPLLLAQLLVRAQYLVDVRNIGAYGVEALSLQSFEYNLFLIGQALGAASATSCLIFWKRPECKDGQLSLLKTHLYLPLLASILVCAGLIALRPWLYALMGLQPRIFGVADSFFGISLLSTIGLSLFGALNGLLIAQDRRYASMLIAGIVVAVKLALGATVRFMYPATDSIQAPITWIAAGGCIILLAMNLVSLALVKKGLRRGNQIPVRDLVGVWGSELGTSLIRSAAPVLFTLQLAAMSGTERFFITNNLCLQLAYIFCLPFLAAMPIAIRDASESFSKSETDNPWWQKLLLTGLVPTSLLLAAGSAIPSELLQTIYGYDLPADHLPFAHFYFLACIVGQLGNTLIVPLRALKRNVAVLRNFLIADVGVQLLATQLLLTMGQASPTSIGLVILIYCGAHLVLNAASLIPELKRGFASEGNAG